MLFLSSHISRRIFSAWLLPSGVILFLICFFWRFHYRFSTTGSSRPPTLPKKVWFKLGPNGLNSETQRSTNSCINQNPDYQPHFLTDESGDEFVRQHFVHRPDLVDTYTSLSIPIVKADMLRYILLFSEGGVWLDLDVSCSDIPINHWIPNEHQHNTNLIVGMELDIDVGDAMRQFASWTIMAKPGVPHLWMVIEDILQAVREKAREHRVPPSQLKVDMVGDIVDFSGPRRLTRSIIKSLETTLDKTIDFSLIADLVEPHLIGDLLILPGYAFAASVNPYNVSLSEHIGPSLVTHHYAGSWKNVNGGETLEV